jgi:hypothetical protein
MDDLPGVLTRIGVRARDINLVVLNVGSFSPVPVTCCTCRTPASEGEDWHNTGDKRDEECMGLSARRSDFFQVSKDLEVGLEIVGDDSKG